MAKRCSPRTPDLEEPRRIQRASETHIQYVRGPCRHRSDARQPRVPRSYRSDGGHRVYRGYRGCIQTLPTQAQAPDFRAPDLPRREIHRSDRSPRPHWVSRCDGTFRASRCHRSYRPRRASRGLGCNRTLWRYGTYRPTRHHRTDRPGRGNGGNRPGRRFWCDGSGGGDRRLGGYRACRPSRGVRCNRSGRLSRGVRCDWSGRCDRCYGCLGADRGLGSYGALCPHLHPIAHRNRRHVHIYNSDPNRCGGLRRPVEHHDALQCRGIDQPWGFRYS
jgi:hypothetical protein